MVAVRYWPLLLAGLLVLLGFLLTPLPLAGQPAVAPLDLTPLTSGTETTTAPASAARTAAASDGTTASRSGMHAGPGHQCDRCAETANLPPWRRRMAEKAAAARNRLDGGF